MYLETSTMKTLKIYNIIATVLILLLVIWVKSLRRDVKENEGLLEECSARYYDELKDDNVF